MLLDSLAPPEPEQQEVIRHEKLLDLLDEANLWKVSHTARASGDVQTTLQKPDLLLSRGKLSIPSPAQAKRCNRCSAETPIRRWFRGEGDSKAMQCDRHSHDPEDEEKDHGEWVALTDWLNPDPKLDLDWTQLPR